MTREPNQAYKDALAAMLAMAELLVETANDIKYALHQERARLQAEVENAK